MLRALGRLFKGNSKKTVQSKTAESKYTASYFEFEDSYGRVAEKKLEKLENYEDVDYHDDPRITRKRFEKALEEMRECLEEIREFCLSQNISGLDYYNGEIMPSAQSSIESLATEFRSFMEGEYEEALAEFLEREKEKKRRSKTEKEVIAKIKANPGIIQSTIYADFPFEDKGFIQRAIQRYVHDGKLRREKAGNSYALFISLD